MLLCGVVCKLSGWCGVVRAVRLDQETLAVPTAAQTLHELRVDGVGCV